MKTLLFVFCLFLILIVCLSLNSAYSIKSSEELIKMVSSLPSPNSEGFEEAMSKFLESWKSKKKLFNLSVSLNRIDEIEDLISSLKEYGRCELPAEFERVRSVLKNHLADLPRFEVLFPLR